jgi:type IV fimbrial biogenesis protein FimT
MHKMVIFHAFRRAHGFTLIELMVTVAVVVILAIVAVPNLQEFATRSGMASIRDDFAIALQRARADAINRNTCVSICQLADGSTSACASAAERGKWHKGWLTYVNDACSAAAPTAVLTATQIIAVRQPGNQRYMLEDQSKVAEDVVTFDARGTLVGGAATYRVIDSQVRDSRHERDIVVSFQGRVSVQQVGRPSSSGGDTATAGAKP